MSTWPQAANATVMPNGQRKDLSPDGDRQISFALSCRTDLCQVETAGSLLNQKCTQKEGGPRWGNERKEKGLIGDTINPFRLENQLCS